MPDNIRQVDQPLPDPRTVPGRTLLMFMDGRDFEFEKREMLYRSRDGRTYYTFVFWAPAASNWADLHQPQQDEEIPF